MIIWPTCSKPRFSKYIGWSCFLAFCVCSSPCLLGCPVANYTKPACLGSSGCQDPPNLTPSKCQEPWRFLRFIVSSWHCSPALCQGCWEKTQPCWVRDKGLYYSLQSKHLVSHVCVSFFCPQSHVGSRECPGRCTWTGFSSQLWNPQLRKPQSFFNNGLQGNLPDFSPGGRWDFYCTIQ